MKKLISSKNKMLLDKDKKGMKAKINEHKQTTR